MLLVFWVEVNSWSKGREHETELLCGASSATSKGTRLSWVQGWATGRPQTYQFCGSNGIHMGLLRVEGF